MTVAELIRALQPTHPNWIVYIHGARAPPASARPSDDDTQHEPGKATAT